MDKHKKPMTDAEIVKRKGALGNDTPGGESLDPTNDRIQQKPMKGIRLHVSGPDTWGTGHFNNKK